MKRSKFSLSHTKLLSCDLGELIPLTWFEVLPGDTLQHATNCLLRAAPLLAPVMHRVDVRIHHFYVPYRLLWDGFEDFITGGPDGEDATSWPVRNYNDQVTTAGDLADYLGLPPGSYPSGTSFTVSELPFRAYNFIWNEYYRDQDLQTEAAFSTNSGNTTGSTSYVLRKVCWEKDYLTSARPWEQKGPSITIPLGTTAPVVGKDEDILLYNLNNATQRVMTTENSAGGRVSLASQPGASGDARFGATTGLETDLTGASAVTINVLREALALQRFEEARARFGSRYTEYLRYLGVRSSDARLQRPEYLGGGRQSIQFSEVLQTGVTTSGNSLGVGTLRGHGIAGVRSNRYRRFIEEHGLVMSLMSVRPKTIYNNGIHRSWLRQVKEDVWQKELETIGQQMVMNAEAYGIDADPRGQFGFQDRYDEYRRMESSVAGEFRTSTLNFWHFARDFSSGPALNSTFVECEPTERTFAVPSQDVLYVMANHSIQARRLVSATGRSMTF